MRLAIARMVNPGRLARAGGRSLSNDEPYWLQAPEMETLFALKRHGAAGRHSACQGPSLAAPRLLPEQAKKAAIEQPTDHSGNESGPKSFKSNHAETSLN